MSIDVQAVPLRYPPRELSPLERELIDKWLALAVDISGAYVSGRKPTIERYTDALSLLTVSMVNRHT